MPGIRARLQEFFGEKFFRDKVTFDKDVTFKKDVVFKRTVTAYSPVSGEPSWGSPHTHYADMLSVDPVDTNWHSIDLSGIGGGALKGVFVKGYFTGNTAGQSVTVSNASGGDPYIIEYFQDATHTNNPLAFSGFVPVDANKAIWYQASSTSISLVRLFVTVWFG